jgi:hypothetical protein
VMMRLRAGALACLGLVRLRLRHNHRAYTSTSCRTVLADIASPIECVVNHVGSPEPCGFVAQCHEPRLQAAFWNLRALIRRWSTHLPCQVHGELV